MSSSSDIKPVKVYKVSEDMSERSKKQDLMSAPVIRSIFGKIKSKYNMPKSKKKAQPTT